MANIIASALQPIVNSAWGLFNRDEPEGSTTPVIDVDSLDPYTYADYGATAPWEHSNYDGEKFYGGFGTTQVFELDYWTLRQRSKQLFTENLYARGLIRRLITNEINTGLTPEMMPEEAIIGVTEDSLMDWAEMVENRFNVWAKNPRVCDYKQVDTFAGLQRLLRTEALIAGDVLVELKQNPRTKLPYIKLVSGENIQTPLLTEQNIRAGHKIKHGVEFDARDRQVAFWVRQADGSYKRLPGFGEKSGRRIAWLVYGTDRKLDDVRGQPLLSLVLQSLKEIDRFRDSTQRKAVINSLLAMFIERTDDKMSTLPMSGGATKAGAVSVKQDDGTSKNVTIGKGIPGMIAERLGKGEKPHAFTTSGTTEHFGVFEGAVLRGVAWANEMPPEILELAFSNNYSASQAAINEFKIYLNKEWDRQGEAFCAPVLTEWLINEVLLGKIKAPGFLDAWRDPAKYDVFGAWVMMRWYGSIKPSTDMLKQGRGSKLLVDEGWSTNAREARVNTGTKYSKNIKKLQRENEQKAAALRPLLELQSELRAANEASTLDTSALSDTITAAIEDALDGDANEEFIEGMLEVVNNA